MSWSEMLESFKKFPDFATEYPFYAALVVVAAVIVVIVICCVFIFLKFPDPALKWMEYGEKRNETTGKRRTSPKHSYLLSIIIVILFVVALFFVIWTIFTRLGEEQTDSSADDDLSSYTEEPEEQADTSTADDLSSYTEELEETSNELVESHGGAFSSRAEIEEVEEVRYVVVQSDVTWSEAEKACEDDGGHLATITSKEEYEQVVDILDNYIQENGSSAEDIFYVWLGGFTGMLDNGIGYSGHTFHWITGEEWSEEIDHLWCNITTDNGTQISEPSDTNIGTGIEENRLALWGQEMTLLWEREEVKLSWTFSDQKGDLPDLFNIGTKVKGRIAYICEYDEYTVDLYD